MCRLLHSSATTPKALRSHIAVTWKTSSVSGLTLPVCLSASFSGRNRKTPFCPLLEPLLCALCAFVGINHPPLAGNPFVPFVALWEKLIYNLAGNPFVSLPSFVGTSVGSNHPPLAGNPFVPFVPSWEPNFRFFVRNPFVLFVPLWEPIIRLLRETSFVPFVLLWESIIRLLRETPLCPLWLC